MQPLMKGLLQSSKSLGLREFATEPPAHFSLQRLARGVPMASVLCKMGFTRCLHAVEVKGEASYRNLLTLTLTVLQMER